MDTDRIVYGELVGKINRFVPVVKYYLMFKCSDW